jgi:hypothetical protein
MRADRTRVVLQSMDFGQKVAAWVRDWVARRLQVSDRMSKRRMTQQRSGFRAHGFVSDDNIQAT